jgi:hypothetical protein
VSSVQIQWGWAVVVIGACTVTSAGVVEWWGKKDSKVFALFRHRGVLVNAGAAIVLGLVSISFFIANPSLLSPQEAASIIEASGKLPNFGSQETDLPLLNDVTVFHQDVSSILGQFRSKVSRASPGPARVMAANLSKRINEIENDIGKVAVLRFLGENPELSSPYVDGVLDIKAKTKRRHDSLTTYSMDLKLTRLALECGGSLKESSVPSIDIPSYRGTVREILDIETRFRDWQLYKEVTFKLGHELTACGKLMGMEADTITHVFIAPLRKKGTTWSVEKLMEKSTGRVW